MASDHVLFHTRFTESSKIQDMTPLVGTRNVRTGYGNARLVSMRTFYMTNNNGGDVTSCYIDVTNSNWIRPQNFTVGNFRSPTILAESSASYEDGRMAPLAPNSTWNAVAAMGSAWVPGTGGYCDVFLLVEIDYDAVPSVKPEATTGYPITVRAVQPGITAQPNVPTRILSFDPLDPGVEYIVTEAKVDNYPFAGGAIFTIITGLQGQRGLNMVIATKGLGEDMVQKVHDSVKLVKQAFNIDMIFSYGITNAQIVSKLQLVANRNGI